MSTVLTGRVYKPEIRYGRNGTAIFTARLQVYHGKDKDGNARTSYFDVKCLGPKAEVYGNTVRERDDVIIVGRLEEERWEKDGVKRSKVVVVIERVGVEPKEEQPAATSTVTAIGKEVYEDEEFLF